MFEDIFQNDRIIEGTVEAILGEISLGILRKKFEWFFREFSARIPWQVPVKLLGGIL